MERRRSAEENQMHVDKGTKGLVQEKTRELHYWAGLTLNAAQGLEDGCKLLLFILAEQRLITFSPQDAQALMEGDQRKTFGQVFKSLKKYVRFEAGQEQSFMKAIENRNWFIHEFYSARAESLVDASGREKGIRELKALSKQFNEADANIKPMIRQLMQRFYKKDIDEFFKEGIERIISDA